MGSTVGLIINDEREQLLLAEVWVANVALTSCSECCSMSRQCISAKAFAVLCVLKGPGVAAVGRAFLMFGKLGEHLAPRSVLLCI